MCLANGNQHGHLDLLFDGTDEDLIDLLKLMLTYNPVFRPPAQILLAHHAFDGIRAKDVDYSLESYHATKLGYDIDKDQNYEFDSVDEWQ